MKIQVTLLFICMIFSGALSLQCYNYNDTASKVTPSQCPYTCASTTTAVNINLVSGVAFLTVIETDYYQYCGSPAECINASMNIGLIKITNNTQCCSTNLCNNKTLAVLPDQRINGKSCYTCDVTGDCTQKLYCVGAEDSCITIKVAQGSNIIPMKGCTTGNVCNSPLLSAHGFILTELECCQGNMCNGAECSTLSFLLMFIPLLSFILLY